MIWLIEYNDYWRDILLLSEFCPNTKDYFFYTFYNLSILSTLFTLLGLIEDSSFYVITDIFLFISPVLSFVRVLLT